MPDAIDTSVLGELAVTIRARRSETGEHSYTRKLLDGGAQRCAKKFGEEAAELVIATVAQDEQAVVAEAADVLYHLLVLLECRGVGLEQVTAELARRQGTSGHAEKAARSRHST